MSVSSFVGPVVTAAVVGGAFSYPVARRTAGATVEGAEIGAEVERERLAHERNAWRASRRDKAAADLVSLNELMEIVGNVEILGDARNEAARTAQQLLVKIVLTLRDPDSPGRRSKALVEKLGELDLIAAGMLWSTVRGSIMEGDLP